MSNFATRDASTAAFWDERFAAGFTPWDAAGVPAALLRFVAGGAAPGRRALIPGCGTGYEARALHTAGFDVLAIDFAEAALARAREALGAALADRLLHHADFFAFEAEPFDWIYERAFLAALPPALWPLWAARCADLLKPGGLLAGFFVIEAALPAVRRGPPFVTTAGELQALLDPGFTQIAATAVPPDESVSVFAGREQWQVWRRRG